ncbi:MAG: fatty acid CoA ligase family protein, partial [Phycisphaerae bacterium]
IRDEERSKGMETPRGRPSDDQRDIDAPHRTDRPFEMAPTRPDDPAAIIFTTGSTGPPKGVLYRHGMFDAQVRILRDHYRIEPGEIDLPTFPLFALFDPALGMTAVIPEMDPTRPAHVDPEKIFEAVRDQKVTHMFGSPALLDRVGRMGEARGVKLPSLRRVISAGAPVPPVTLRRFGSMLDAGAEIFTPYGATEALPVCSIGSREILGETATVSERGGGTCVGRPVPGAELGVIEITDSPIEKWSDDLLLPPGTIGEIVVKGPVVTREYITSDSATRLAKIRDGLAVWHRMGDVGYLDERGRLWFCGRKSHRVVSPGGTLFTVPCEAIFNGHKLVRRSALVGVGKPPSQRPVICVEPERGAGRLSRSRRAGLIRELRDQAAGHDHTKLIETFLIHPSFPVDIRHNAKIFREKLAEWAAYKMS